MEKSFIGFIRYITSKWVYLVLGAVIGISAGYFYVNKFLRIEYSAETSMYISKKSDQYAYLNTSELEVYNRLITDCNQIILSQKLFRTVIEKTNLDADYSEYLENLELIQKNESNMFAISYKSNNPKITFNVANTVAESLLEVTSEIMDFAIFYIVDRATVPLEPIDKKTDMLIILSGVSGILIACICIFIPYTFYEIIVSESDFSRRGFEILFDIKNKISIKPLSYTKKFYPKIRMKHSNNIKKVSELSNFLVNSNVRTILMTSDVSTVKKTGLALELTLDLIKKGKDVILVDCDSKKSVTKCFKKRGKMDKATSGIKIKFFSVFETISKKIDYDILYSDEIQNKLKSTISSHEIIIINAPSTSGRIDFLPLLNMTDICLFTVIKNSSIYNRIYKAHKLFDSLGAKSVKFLYIY